MIELAFVVCMLGNDQSCHEERLLFVDVPVRACMLGAQAELATWVGEHQGWRITRWTCRSLEQTAQSL